MEVFKVHYASDEKIILKDDRQLDTLFKEITGDKDFKVQWIEKDETRTKLFLGDGLLSRLKDGRMVLEARKESSKEEVSNKIEDDEK